MKGLFSFELAVNVRLKTINNKYYLVCETPLRYLEVNASLDQMIKEIISGDQKKINNIVLSLVAKGYLKMNYHQVNLPSSELPPVTIIIPVKNRPLDIFDCLTSLKTLDYPKDKMEIVVVDDGSNDDTREVIRSFDVRLICNDSSMGPAECRNIGEKAANGEILVFLDSDCTVKKDWLRDIIPFFAVAHIGAIGGFVDSYYSKTSLDRYEMTCSPLNMGKRVLFDNQGNSNFYVPSCNFFVKRNVFREIGGFKTGMHVGEDVDFCWRMRQAGYPLLYLPLGVVFHKHRNILSKMLTRRLQYGTSEAALYSLHPEIRKKFTFPLNSGLSFLFFVAGILTQNYLFFLGILFFGGWDYFQKKNVTDNSFLPKRRGTLVLSIARGMFSFYYYASFLLIRYYLIPLILLGLFVPSVFVLSAAVILIASTVDYTIKKPRMFFPIFLFFYVLEHLAYQIGVILGCIKNRYFGCYLPSLFTTKKIFGN